MSSTAIWHETGTWLTTTANDSNRTDDDLLLFDDPDKTQLLDLASARVVSLTRSDYDVLGRYNDHAIVLRHESRVLELVDFEAGTTSDLALAVADRHRPNRDHTGRWVAIETTDGRVAVVDIQTGVTAGHVDGTLVAVSQSGAVLVERGEVRPMTALPTGPLQWQLPH